MESSERNNSKPEISASTFLLGTVLGFLALNAFAGGYYGMSGAEQLPIKWLAGSPFHSYFVPGLFLFLVVGGSALFASIAVFKNNQIAYRASLMCGIIVLTWLAVQFSIIGYVSWMQPATAIVAAGILCLTWFCSNEKSLPRP